MSIPRIGTSLFDPYEAPRPERTHDVQGAHGFELIADARAERRRHIELLSRDTWREQSLATDLDRCRRGQRCLSPACMVCWRRFRIVTVVASPR